MRGACADNKNCQLFLFKILVIVIIVSFAFACWGRPIMVKGGSLFNLASQRRLVKRSKSCMVIRGPPEKSFREVKVVIFFRP